MLNCMRQFRYPKNIETKMKNIIKTQRKEKENKMLTLYIGVTEQEVPGIQTVGSQIA